MIPLYRHVLLILFIVRDQKGSFFRWNWSSTHDSHISWFLHFYAENICFSYLAHSLPRNLTGHRSVKLLLLWFIWIILRGLGPVHTYPDIFESATFFFRIRKYPRPHVMWSQRIHIEFARPHVFGFTPDSLRIDKIVHQALVRPGLTQNRRRRHCFPSRLSCFSRPFCPVDNVKSLQMSSPFWHNLFQHVVEPHFSCIQAKRLEISARSTEAIYLRSAAKFKFAK